MKIEGSKSSPVTKSNYSQNVSPLYGQNGLWWDVGNIIWSWDNFLWFSPMSFGRKPKVKTFHNIYFYCESDSDIFKAMDP